MLAWKKEVFFYKVVMDLIGLVRKLKLFVHSCGFGVVTHGHKLGNSCLTYPLKTLLLLTGDTDPPTSQPPSKIIEIIIRIKENRHEKRRGHYQQLFFRITKKTYCG